MVLVQCDMCGDIHDLNEWKESNIFICLICAKILQKIKRKEIELNRVYSEESRMKIFDTLRFKEVNFDDYFKIIFKY